MSALKINIRDCPTFEISNLHPGRGADLILEGKNIGFFGQIHPLIQKKYSIVNRTYIFQLKFDELIKAATRKSNWITEYKHYPTVPSMERDISLYIDEKILISDIISTINKADKVLIENIELIDRFTTLVNNSSKHSLTFRITYRDRSRTLKDETVNPIHDRIRKELVKKYDVELRS